MQWASSTHRSVGSRTLERGRSCARLERFRRGEDDQPAAGFELRERGATLRHTQSAVEHDDRHAVARERAFLVGHEGNERRDDNRRPIDNHRWSLANQRLSKTGRKRHWCIASLEDGNHRRLLFAPEPLDTERPAHSPAAHIEQTHDAASRSQPGINPRNLQVGRIMLWLIAQAAGLLCGKFMRLTSCGGTPIKIARKKTAVATQPLSPWRRA